jgi:predicted transposase YbfD/YdcC
LEYADYVRERLHLPGCRLILRVDREVRTRGGELVSHEIRYFVSSLDPDFVTAEDLLRHVRNHWRVENGLHFMKDRWWDEDRHGLRRPGLAACYAPINNAALSILCLDAQAKQPLRAAADLIAWNVDLGLRLLKS